MRSLAEAGAVDLHKVQPAAPVTSGAGVDEPVRLVADQNKTLKPNE
jgi:hypothetical protein